MTFLKKSWKKKFFSAHETIVEQIAKKNKAKSVTIKKSDFYNKTLGVFSVAKIWQLSATFFTPKNPSFLFVKVVTLYRLIKKIITGILTRRNTLSTIFNHFYPKKPLTIVPVENHTETSQDYGGIKKSAKF